MSQGLELLVVALKECGADHDAEINVFEVDLSSPLLATRDAPRQSGGWGDGVCAQRFIIRLLLRASWLFCT